jgi:hypothetical protein
MKMLLLAGTVLLGGSLRRNRPPTPGLKQRRAAEFVAGEEK